MISNLKIRRSSLMAPWLAMLALLLFSGGCTMSAPEVREELSLEVEVDPEALTKYSKYAMESDEFSIETLLALTDDYFEN
ncbi:MAG: hypothetical protein KAR06_09065, partial [Deltaproteobacteria bacterium]|nr:hypothetical protein [Deltaproteobacteria bacterium]